MASSEFKVTRESLRFVSKLIKEEWTPAFLRSTTICLDWQRTPWLFETVFLRYFDYWEIRNIRRLFYDGSRKQLFRFNFEFRLHKLPNLPRDQADRLQELGALLRRKRGYD